MYVLGEMDCNAVLITHALIVPRRLFSTSVAAC